MDDSYKDDLHDRRWTTRPEMDYPTRDGLPDPRWTTRPEPSKSNSVLNQPSEDTYLVPQRINRSITDLDQHLGEQIRLLDYKIVAYNQNMIARARNRAVILGDVALWPLHSIETGEVIPNFPQDVNHMDALSARDVDGFLRHLGEPIRGSAPEKKRKLKIASG
ncbi:hypothetical protein G6O67_008092 [Ophiocordyceps sinensis]|uniref:Uncharacterized protein n=1 Tax=Ophiocordyceps sinensis TaxID=72228 RepID=A0A8H4PGQ3_9HYPO|nr:hypothetical protein G6O67_008092 [Ophiocordyceps sinensis]